MEKPAFIYLVVLESNKFSITSASFDQFKAQRLCHLYAASTSIPHAVKKEAIKNVPFDCIASLCEGNKRFAKEFDAITK